MSSTSSSRKLLCIVIILLLFLGIALTAAGIAVYLHYMGNRKEAKETQSYMRSLINQINTAADVRWKVKLINKIFKHEENSYNI
uniref:Uncharacterized protein n=1 Tax=Panagrolaimus sp. PS1159 TaxID=55785 RepID=A0AC35GP57_9BILA